MITGFAPYYADSSAGKHVELGMPLDHDDIKAKLKEHSEVSHVFIPQTWFGYGASLVMLANNEALERDYGKRVHTIGTELAFTRAQIIRFPDLWELIAGLAYDYPVYDEETFSRMETETLTDFVRECLQDELPDVDPETVTDWLWENTEVWMDGQTAYIDSDGCTPYMSKESLEALVVAFNAA